MPASSPSPVGNMNMGGADRASLTASAIIAPAMSGSHVVKIDGYSCTKGVLGNGKYVESETFTIGGHRWRVHYYPDGYGSSNTDWISVFLFSDRSDGSEVKAGFKVSLLDQDRQPVPLHTSAGTQICTFSSKQPSWGFDQFIRRNDLEESRHLKDDVFSIRCDVTVPKGMFTEPIRPTVAVVVPPSDMHRHLGQLLLAGEAADVTFKVGAEEFAAHRCILAARSSVFKAELLGPMKEKASTHIRIDDMEPGVFKALLRFIYTDSLPVMDEGDEAAAAQHLLLVAADRYNMERLKLICEGKLCDHICKSTVATMLALAEQHGCGALEKACFRFLTSPGNLKAVMASDGYEHLRSSCPSVIDELVAMLAP